MGVVRVSGCGVLLWKYHPPGICLAQDPARRWHLQPDNANAGCSMGDQLRVSVCVSQSISTTFCILGHTIERDSRGQRLCLRGRTMLGVPDVSGFASRGQGYHWGSAVDTG